MIKVLLVILFMSPVIYFNNLIVFYSSLCFFLSFSMLLMYNMKAGGVWILMSSYLGMDSYSYYMILMSLWVVGLMYLSLFGDNYMDKVKLFMFILALLVLLLFFSSVNLMMLYFFFEVSLIPTFFIVVFWGSNYERLEASFYLIMYMMFISFPLLVYIMKIFFFNYTLDMNMLNLDSFNSFSAVIGSWDYLVLFLAFFIKLPVYFFHIWLPKAHVEAPVYGSMLLAAILLKLGGYGLIRLVMMFMKKSLSLNEVIMSVGILGSVYISIHCLTQVDMKSLVAYSSVVHMNFMLCSLYSMLKMGFTSSILVMISHGLCSSGLFYMVNMFYKRTYSRMFILNKSSLSMVSSAGIWWFLLCSSNFSFPFSLNFLGEIMVIMVLLGWSGDLVIFIGLISFFSGAYSLYLFSSVMHGQMTIDGSSDDVEIFSNSLLVEHLSLFLHYSPLLFLMLNLSMFVN